MDNISSLVNANMTTDDSGHDIVGWVMSRVQRWRNKRDQEFQTSWNEYYSIWKGDFTNELKTRQEERSKLIAPATQQAVDATVAEMAEATFGRGAWFDVRDDVESNQDSPAALTRDKLREDFDECSVQQAVLEAYLNGAIFGTGIAKRVIGEREVTTITQDEYGNPVENSIMVPYVSWESIAPFNFVIDSSAKTTEEALGCAHETILPIHEIYEKQQSGEFLPGTIGSMSGFVSSSIGLNGSDTLLIDPADGAYITEYHGLIPESFFIEETEESVTDEVEDESEEETGERYVEAIVVIANGSTLLKKEQNPFPGGDRGIIAYPHDTVPDSFWGRGVCEKAYNAQKALDAELRARIDSLGLLTYPIVGADATRLPRNLNLSLKPGKVFLTNGRPSEIIEPIKLGSLDQLTFQQSGDLERMVQMSTGAFDSASPTGVNSANETASGASMLTSSMIKRAKLTMQNIDKYFLSPLVRKSLVAYMSINPERYPMDVKFRVNSTMSIMAREFEQVQMTNLLAIIPNESPAFLVVLKGIVENYSGPSKDKILEAINQMMQPNPEQQKKQQMMDQLQMQGAMLSMQELQKKIEKIDAEIALLMAKTGKEKVLTSLEDDKVEIDTARVMLEKMQTEVQQAQVALKSKELNVRQAEVRNKPNGSNSRTK